MNAFGYEEEMPPVRCNSRDAVKARFEPDSCSTRLVSWLESERPGTHPRTKGARCFTGGHRRGVVLTAGGLLKAHS